MPQGFFYTQIFVLRNCYPYFGNLKSNSITSIFPNIIGQTDLQSKLVDMVNRNRLSHAILMVGQEGTGVLPLAMGFAQYVVSIGKQKKDPLMVADLFGGMSALPEEKKEDSTEIALSGFESFDKKALDLMHPDLHFSYPVIKKDPNSTAPAVSGDFASEWRQFYKTHPYGNLFDWLQFIKADNKQGNITAKECDDIIHKINLKSFESRYKVLLMWMPEALGNEGNRLLKLIEEPPPDTLFIFAAENEEKLLSTIISRCQVIRVPPLKVTDIAGALEEKHQFTPEKASQLALVSGGSYREAEQLIEHHEEEWNALLRDWLNATMMATKSGNPFADQNQIVNTLSTLGREKQKQLLLYFLELIDQSLRILLVGTNHLQLPKEEAEFALRLTKVAGPSTLGALAKLLEPAIYYVERNANPKMLFHSLTIKMRYIIKERRVVGGF